LSIFHPSRNIEISVKKESSGGSLALRRTARRVEAAFIDQESDQAVNGRIVGAADERRNMTLLGDQPSHNQPMQMVGKRRGGDPEFIL
jgi:hypothetical protein